MTTVVVDRGWRARAVEGGVELTAGADVSYLLPDLPVADAAVLARMFGPTPADSPCRIETERLSGAVGELVPRLLALGALRPCGLPSSPDPTVRLALIGEDPSALCAALAATLSVVDTDAELILVVRTTATWRDLIDQVTGF